jgi:hypothetical protein
MRSYVALGPVAASSSRAIEANVSASRSSGFSDMS